MNGLTINQFSSTACKSQFQNVRVAWVIASFPKRFLKRLAHNVYQVALASASTAMDEEQGGLGTGVGLFSCLYKVTSILENDLKGESLFGI